MRELREQMIRDYVDGYNKFDIAKMIANFDKNIKFENISNGISNMSLQGIDSFKVQAENATTLFLSRKQTIKSFTHKDDETEIEIDYHGVLATDFPNGLKKNDELKLQGKSIFKFSGDKIIALTDIS